MMIQQAVLHEAVMLASEQKSHLPGFGARRKAASDSVAIDVRWWPPRAASVLYRTNSHYYSSFVRSCSVPSFWATTKGKPIGVQ